MTDEIFKRLKQFIIDKIAVEDEEVTREAKMQDDLGIYGDEAFEFLVAYGKEFDVNVSHFMAADYFDGEGDPILPTIIRLVTGKKKKPNKILTVGHLEKGIIAKRLDEEIINTAN